MNAAGYSSSQILYNITPTYSPIPAYPYFSGSPIASPVPPSPKTPKKLYSSYTAVNRASNEHDSLIRWLKSLRLHKYYSMFDNITFEEVRVSVCVWGGGGGYVVHCLKVANFCVY